MGRLGGLGGLGGLGRLGASVILRLSFAYPSVIVKGRYILPIAN